MDHDQQPVIRMGEILTMTPESDALSGDVLNRLGTTWTEIPATEIARNGVFGIARELTVILPDGEGFSNALRLRVAEEVIALLHRFGIDAQAPQPRVTTTTVRIERNFSEMSLRQLLEAIVTDPEVYPEAVRYIKRHPELQNATRKTYKWVVPVNEDGTGIDIEATMRYVLELDKPHSVPQRRVERRRPVWLGRAMGVNDLPLIHIITGRLVQGPDENGFDWSTRPKELLEAIIWARKTGHTQLPDLQSDVYGWSEQLFHDPLPRRFQNILDDYLDAKEARVSTTDGIRADWPEDLPFEQRVHLHRHSQGRNGRLRGAGARSRQPSGSAQQVWHGHLGNWWRLHDHQRFRHECLPRWPDRHQRWSRQRDEPVRYGVHATRQDHPG